MAEQDHLNVLILGETGVGKSTWINSIANYLQFRTFQEATQNRAENLISLIPSKFKAMDPSTDIMMEIKIGTPDENEKNTPGTSATQYPKEYQFVVNNTTVNLIDTPGIGDTKGIDKDKENFDNILTFISNYEYLHGVVILLKPNQSRLSLGFTFCIQELLTHLHRSLAQNIIFGFTHTRGTTYSPGDTFVSLQELITNNKLPINLVKDQTYFCFDNEAFRYLACIKNGFAYENGDRAPFKKSWDKASETTRRLISHIQCLPPHDIRNTISMNEARNIVLSLTEPMAQIVHLLEENNESCLEMKKKIETDEIDLRDCQKDLLFLGYSIETNQLDFPQTVCAHPDCVEHYNVGQSRIQDTVFKTVCHEICTVNDGSHHGVNNPYLKWCKAFYMMGALGLHCRRCHHSYKDHKHIAYTKKVVRKQFANPEAEAKRKAKGTLKEEKEETLNQLMQQKREYEYEQDILRRSAAEFATFMKNTALIPYNDSFVEYLDMMIRYEEKKPDYLRDLETIEKLKQHRVQYKEEISMLKKAMKSGARTLTNPKEIFMIKKTLLNLKHFGPNIREILGNRKLNLYTYFDQSLLILESIKIGRKTMREYEREQQEKKLQQDNKKWIYNKLLG